MYKADPSCGSRTPLGGRCPVQSVPVRLCSSTRRPGSECSRQGGGAGPVCAPGVLSTLLLPLRPPAASLHLLTVSCLHSDLTQNALDSSRIAAFQCNPCSVPKGFAEARSNQYYINTSANCLLTVNTVIVLKTMELMIFSGL